MVEVASDFYNDMRHCSKVGQDHGEIERAAHALAQAAGLARVCFKMSTFRRNISDAELSIVRRNGEKLRSGRASVSIAFAIQVSS